MSINDIGKEGELLARHVLLDKFGVDGIFQADWIIQRDGKYYVVEVKHKERFKAPPFDGHGLDVQQVKWRMKFFRDLGVRCLFLVIEMDGTIYWQWLDVLEQKRWFDTRKGIRVYDLKGFKSPGKIAQAG